MSVNKYTTAEGLVTLANGSRMWVGTKAAYDSAKQAGTMPNDVLVAITDDSQDNNYSTEEVLTGKFWIDGKPIYRKVNLCTAAATIPAGGAYWVVVPGWTMGDSDTETITHWECPTVGQGSCFYYQGINNNQWACIATAITIPVGASLIVEYTKTTD